MHEQLCYLENGRKYVYTLSEVSVLDNKDFHQ